MDDVLGGTGADDVTEDTGRRLAERFEADRRHLTAVAHRLLGSAAEAAARQLAGRARRRVQSRPAAPAAAVRRRRAVDAFLAATRGGGFTALVALLDPDVVLHADALVVPTPEPITVRGAAPVAQGAMAAVARAQLTGLALLDGEFVLVMAERGRLRLVRAFAFGADARIARIDVVAEPERLRATEIAAVDPGRTGAGGADAELDQ